MFVDIICMLTAAIVAAVGELVAVGGVVVEALANSQRANNEGGPAGMNESKIEYSKSKARVRKKILDGRSTNPGPEDKIKK